MFYLTIFSLYYSLYEEIPQRSGCHCTLCSSIMLSEEYVTLSDARALLQTDLYTTFNKMVSSATKYRDLFLLGYSLLLQRLSFSYRGLR